MQSWSMILTPITPNLQPIVGLIFMPPGERKKNWRGRVVAEDRWIGRNWKQHTISNHVNGPEDYRLSPRKLIEDGRILYSDFWGLKSTYGRQGRGIGGGGEGENRWLFGLFVLCRFGVRGGGKLNFGFYKKKSR